MKPRASKRPRTRTKTRRSRSPTRGARRFTTISGRRLYASPERYPRLYEWIVNVGDSTE